MDNLGQAWEGVLEFLRAQPDISTVAYDMWLRCIEPVRIEGNAVVLQVHTDFQRGIIDGQYGARIKEGFQQVLGIPFDIMVISEEAKKKEQETEVKDFPQAENLFGKKSSDYEYSFENFVVGTSNKFAHTAAQAVALKPAGAYNPLFIYGGSGLGKTHLLYAICNEIKKNNPDIRILYTKGENITIELIEALGQNKMADFRAKYRQVDVLLIDDIQFIAGKQSTQEEFFHTFDALHQANKQIVLSSDRPPREIATLTDRLRGRFEMGLLADVQPPDLEMRIAIIKQKAQMLGIDMPDDVAEYVASQLKNNVRQLEGVVRRMQAQYMLGGERPSMLIAQAAIRDIRNDNQPIPITVDRIITEVARSMQVTPDDIRSNKKSASISLARQVAEYVVREITSLQMKEIGREFGGRDHSTVVYAIQKLEERMANNPSLKGLVNDIIKNLSNN